ncbi:MAG: DUF3795 domain-containing protein [Dehalococcoidia bacterium]|nr:DUF3795 domain-containing protein [Dehalococcoidia bacterium]
MEDPRTLTSYCGLYCRDCIPANRRLFALAAELESQLADLHFKEYAAFKAKREAVFGDYQAFLRVLQAIRGLECMTPCRTGGGKDTCTVRDCVQRRNLLGCWECAEYGSCELLGPLKRFHPNLEHHLELIRREGINGWSAKRKGHYPWH